MNSLESISKYIDVVNEYIGRGAAWLNIVMVLVVCFDVFTRYVLNSSSIAVQEIEWHLFAIIFLLGAAYTLKNERHVRVDAFYAQFSDRTKTWINIGGTLLFLIPFCILVMWASWTFVANSFASGETSPDPGGLPFRYLLKACIPFAFFLLMMQGISSLLKSFAELRDLNRGGANG